MIIKEEVYISFLKKNRMLHIYFPNKINKEDNFPVLYMFDGHNLFNDKEATYHKSWGLQKYLDSINAKIIVVGIECNHEGIKRLCEFSPYSFKDKNWGNVVACGKEFTTWIVKELKPWIDNELPTLRDSEFTSIAGSSMGGLMALYGGSMYPDTFSKAACLSSYYSHVFAELINDLKNTHNLINSSFYLSWGAKEWNSKKALAKDEEDNLAIAHILNAKRAKVYTHCYEEGFHNEESWEKEIPVFFKELKMDVDY